MDDWILEIFARKSACPTCRKCGTDAVDIDFTHEWICPVCPLPIVVARKIEVADLIDDPIILEALEAA